MSKEIEAIEVQEGLIESDSIKVSPYGITFKGAPTIEEWHKAVLGIEKVHGMLQFYLGDLAVYAESPVTGWGESKYADLIAATGYEYDSIKRYAGIARRFPISFRRSIMGEQGDTYPHVSFGHFSIVAPLGDIPAKHFLEMVRDGKWTVARLRDEVRKYKDMGKLEDGKPAADNPIGLSSFKEVGKNLLKGYVPQEEDKEYDEVSWLIEIRDWAESRLQELGVEA